MLHKRHRSNHLVLPSDKSTGNFLAQKTITGNYSATVKVHAKKSTAVPGIAVIGDENNLIAALYEKNSIRVVQLKDGKETTVSKQEFTAGEKFYLRVVTTHAKALLFQFSSNGKSWKSLNDMPIDAGYLPPWDRAVRVGLISKGNLGSLAVFDQFKLKNESSLK